MYCSTVHTQQQQQQCINLMHSTKFRLEIEYSVVCCVVCVCVCVRLCDAIAISWSEILKLNLYAKVHQFIHINAISTLYPLDLNIYSHIIICFSLHIIHFWTVLHASQIKYHTICTRTRVDHNIPYYSIIYIHIIKENKKYKLLFYINMHEGIPLLHIYFTYIAYTPRIA